MVEQSLNKYIPDEVSPPGDTLRELIEYLNLSQNNLALRMGRPIKTINEILQGKTEITPETAHQLELVLNVPAYFWINREAQYKEYCAKLIENGIR